MPSEGSEGFRKYNRHQKDGDCLLHNVRNVICHTAGKDIKNIQNRIVSVHKV